jgi:uncharacterized protein (DUF2235 family)
MKNIVILFDGTWNTADAAYPSNVVKIGRLVLPRTSDGTDQIVFYHPGVGAGEVAVGKWLDTWLGGAFGVGLMENIAEAYRFLTFNYAPGDRIFIFGFSRGAFSARSFGGLLRTCGILKRENVGKVREAIRLYQNRDDRPTKDANGKTVSPPDNDRYLVFRRDNSQALSNSSYERTWRAGAGRTPESPAITPTLSIEYMGVWDTVGALGIPSGFLFANTFNRRYRFHDLQLSRMVRSARQALAIDERRRTFEATPWSNIDDLNISLGAIEPTSPSRAYQQQWFPGDHGTIGGCGDVNGLWEAAFAWVAEGAVQRGLGLDSEGLDAHWANVNLAASTSCMARPAFSFANLSFKAWRRGPTEQEAHTVSEWAARRVRMTPKELGTRRAYRPRTLRAVLPHLLAEPTDSSASQT